jgi:hypothetical protein
MRFNPIVVASCLAVLSGPVAAQQKDACYDRVEGQVPSNTYYNAQSTDTWRQLLFNADQQLMAQVAGTYYADVPSSDGQFVSHQYRSFEPNGLFQYQDQTCGNIPGIPCSQNQGTGEWRATTWSDGSIYIMARFSDLSRTSACAGARYRPGPSGLQDEFGSFWQRVQ